MSRKPPRAPSLTAPARRRTGKSSGASIIGNLAALVDHALDGTILRLRGDVSQPLRRVCAERIARLADEPADVIAIVEVVVAETGLPAPGEAVRLTGVLMNGVYPPFFYAWLEMLVGSLPPARQSSLWALAVILWAISEAKNGPVNIPSDYTPSIERVVRNVELSINGDFIDCVALTALLSDLLRHNPHVWQIKGRRRRERTGE